MSESPTARRSPVDSTYREQPTAQPRQSFWSHQNLTRTNQAASHALPLAVHTFALLAPDNPDTYLDDAARAASTLNIIHHLGSCAWNYCTAKIKQA